MIDRTNFAIVEMEEESRQDRLRRTAFYDMLHATDRVLWKLEEMNRDGVERVPERMRSQIRDALEPMPESVRGRLRDTAAVQEMLDSVFDVQEGLFRWRHPGSAAGDGDEEDLDRAS